MRSLVPAVLLLLPLCAFAQVTEMIEVHVAEVEVVVVDSHGKPVSGLTKNDFELREGGQLRDITNFYAVDRGTLLREADAVPAPAAAAAPEPPLPAPPTHLVIFVDQERLDLRQRNRVLASLAKFAQTHLKPGVDASLITYNESAKVRLQPTTDGAKLQAMIAELGHESVRFNEAVSNRRRIVQLIDEAADKTRRSRGTDEIKHSMVVFSEAQIFSLRQSLEVMEDLMSRLRGVPGRKIFVHVSSGLPLQPAVELFEYFQRRLGENLALDKLGLQQGSAYERLIAAAQAAGVSLYMIDAGGITVDGGSNVSDVEGGRLDARLIRDNLRGPLQLMADETGGKAILDENDFDRAFADIEAQYSTYYSLGFHPAAGDKAMHKVDVRVKRPGLAVRSTRAYRERDADELTREAVEAAFDFPLAANPHGLAVNFGTMQPSGGSVAVPISVTVAPGKLIALSEGGLRKAHVRCYYEVRNASGGISPLRVVDEAIVIVSEAAPVVLRKVAGIRMHPGRYTLSMAVRDLLSNETSYVLRPVEVAAAAAP